MSNNRENIINESFGSWLNRARQWAGGVGKGALSGTVLGKKEDPAYNTQVQDQLYRAEILQSMIFDAANTIDSVLRSLEGTDLRKRALESGSDMISFLQQSIKTVQSIISEAGGGDMTNKSNYEKDGGLSAGRKKQLDEISEKLKQIIPVGGGGVLDKWCREFLGKHNEGFESNEYLSTGNQLVIKATAILSEISKADEMDRKIAEKDVDKVLRRGLKQLGKYVNGEADTEEIRLPKPGGEQEQLIDREAEKNLPAVVQKFRKDLRKLQIETSTEDIWSEKDDPCAEEAAEVVRAVTKKKYQVKTKDGFKELQRDTDRMVRNQKKIKELLLPVKPLKI
jgi:hypothetical protein